MFIVYFDYIPSIVGLSSYSCICSYSTHPKDPWVGGRHYVSMVLIRCLPANTPYIPGHVVDRGCGYDGRQALFLIFLSNIPYV